MRGHILCFVYSVVKGLPFRPPMCIFNVCSTDMWFILWFYEHFYYFSIYVYAWRLLNRFILFHFILQLHSSGVQVFISIDVCILGNFCLSFITIYSWLYLNYSLRDFIAFDLFNIQPFIGVYIIFSFLLVNSFKGAGY